MNEGTRRAVLVLTMVGAAAIAALVISSVEKHPPPIEEPIEATTPARKIVEINVARHDEPKTAKALGRVCPKGEVCRVTGAAPRATRRVHMLDRDRTLVIDDTELSVVGPGDRSEQISQPTGATILATALDRNENLVAIDALGNILEVTKDGKKSQIVDTVPASTRFRSRKNRETHAEIAFQNDAMLFTLGDRFMRRARPGSFEEIELPGFSESVADDAGPDDIESSTRRARLQTIVLGTDAKGRVVLAYNEPPGTARRVARVFRYEHGLATEWFGLEDMTIEQIALGQNDDIWLSAHEALRDGKQTERVLLRRNSETLRVFETDEKIFSLGFDDDEICFTTRRGRGISWYSTRDPKIVPPARDVDLPAGLISAVECRGHSRLAVSVDAYVVDFDGSRVLTILEDDVLPSLRSSHSLFKDEFDHVNVTGLGGTFRLPSFDEIDPFEAMFPSRAPDGTWWSQMRSKQQDWMLGRWDGATWIAPRPIPQSESFLFAASASDTFTATGLNLPPLHISLNGARIATLEPRFGAVIGGYGVRDNAFFLLHDFTHDVTEVRHWNGKELTRVEEVGAHVRSIVGTGIDDVTALSSDRKNFHFDGATWSAWPSLPEPERGIRAFANGRGRVSFVSTHGIGDLTATTVKLTPFAPANTYGFSIVSQGKTTWIAADGVIYARSDE